MYTEIKTPVSTACGGIFCKSCLQKNSEYSSKCPKCRQDLDGHIAVQQICAKLFEKELEQIYKCPNGDCKKMIKYKDIPIHINNKCEYTEIKCTNKDCSATFTKKMKSIHMETCIHKPVICPHCRKEMSAKQIDDHIKNKCPNILVECTFKCPQKIKRIRLPMHLARCVNRPTKCQHKECSQYLNGKLALEAHLMVCPYALVKCDYCNDAIVYNMDLDNHYKLCMDYQIECELCKTIYTKKVDHVAECKMKKCSWCETIDDKKTITEHEEKCIHRPVKCACGISYKVKDTEYHLQTCRESETKCPFGCSDIIKRKDEEKHFEVCDEVYTVCKYSKHGICYAQFPRKYKKDHDCDELKSYEIVNPHIDNKFVPGLTIEMIDKIYDATLVKKTIIYMNKGSYLMLKDGFKTSTTIENVFPFGTFRKTTYSKGTHTIYHTTDNPNIKYKGVIDKMDYGDIVIKPSFHAGVINIDKVHLASLGFIHSHIETGMYIMLADDIIYKVISIDINKFVLKAVKNYYDSLDGSVVIKFLENNIVKSESNVKELEYSKYIESVYGIPYYN